MVLKSTQVDITSKMWFFVFKPKIGSIYFGRIFWTFRIFYGHEKNFEPSFWSRIWFFFIYKIELKTTNLQWYTTPPKNVNFDQKWGNFFSVEYSRAVEYSTTMKFCFWTTNLIKYLRFFFQKNWIKIDKNNEVQTPLENP